jgi:hypothetical protein
MKYFGITLFAACAAIGCGTTPSTQVLTGTATNALAVRAVSGTTIVTASAVTSSGAFSLSLPAGAQYRLEMLTSNGVEPVVTSGSHVVEFRVCHAGAPFDVGTIGHVTTGDGSGSGSGGGGHGSGCMGGMGGGSGGMGGGHGHGNGSDACDADPSTCGCSGGSDCWGSGAGPMCGSDGTCSGGGTCDRPPGDLGCGTGSGSD